MCVFIVSKSDALYIHLYIQVKCACACAWEGLSSSPFHGL